MGRNDQGRAALDVERVDDQYEPGSPADGFAGIDLPTSIPWVSATAVRDLVESIDVEGVVAIGSRWRLMGHAIGDAMDRAVDGVGVDPSSARWVAEGRRLAGEFVAMSAALHVFTHGVRGVASELGRLHDRFAGAAHVLATAPEELPAMREAESRAANAIHRRLVMAFFSAGRQMPLFVDPRGEGGVL